jgi:hypothetical protein
MHTLSISYGWESNDCLTGAGNWAALGRFFVYSTGRRNEIGTEMTHMPEIYEQAAVTSASRSSRLLDGLVQDREITRNPERVFKLPYTGPNGELGNGTRIMECVGKKLLQSIEAV